MIDLSIWRFPVSLILVAVFACGIYLLRGRKAASVLTDWRVAVALACLTAVLVALEGSFGWKIHRSYPFATLLILLIASSLLVALKEKKISFVASHGGFALMLAAAFFGAPDMMKGHMKLNIGQTDNVCIEADGTMVPLPFNVKLVDFTVSSYENSETPKQYTSTLEIDGLRKQTKVNRPLWYKGYHFYQSGYDIQGRQYSILLITKDRWYLFVLALMIVLAAGSIMSLGGKWGWKWFWPITIGVAALFTILSVARISFATLPPALRSIWFVPHLLVYMVAYSLLAIALVLGIINQAKPGSKLAGIPSKLLSTSSTLLLVGMSFGAVWAKQAWGDYWTWDPKECWAAATWLLTIAGTHFSGKSRTKASAVFILVSFLFMQVTWYGVNYLPSAQNSIHTYTK